VVDMPHSAVEGRCRNHRRDCDYRVATNSPKPLSVRDGVIEISPEQQIKGAIHVGGWPCGPETYYLTIQAFVMNLDGQKSNVVEYTIHCNGG
jgi:hypothetical protein